MCLSVACLTGNVRILAQSFNVIQSIRQQRTFTVDPVLPSDGKYPSGTVVTVTANLTKVMFLMPFITRKKVAGDKCILIDENDL